jgi:hypothetical protein
LAVGGAKANRHFPTYNCQFKEIPVNNSPPSLSDQFEAVTDLLKHEDNLINQRTSWAMAVQGLLFNAIGLAIGLFEKFKFNDPVHTPIHTALFIICGIGIITSLGAFFAISAAEYQQIALREWWNTKTSNIHDSSISDHYPTLYPLNKLKSFPRGSHSFLGLIIVWILIILVIILSPHLIPITPNA